MPLNGSDTRAKLIDRALRCRGWTEDFIRREQSAGAVYVVDGQPRRQAQGRADYTLRLPVVDSRFEGQSARAYKNLPI